MIEPTELLCQGATTICDVRASALHTPLDRNAHSQSGDIFFISLADDEADISFPVTLGNPFPADWGRTASASCLVLGSVRE